MGGELAKLAFQYLKANTPDALKNEASGAFNMAAKGRFTAFKNWLSSCWSGDSNLTTVVGDYEDYLAMFGPDATQRKISLREFFDATRSPGDRGDFETYQAIMNAMGQKAERDHYVGLRQEARNDALKKQFDKMSNKINVI